MFLINLLALVCVLPQIKSNMNNEVCHWTFDILQCDSTQETEFSPVLPAGYTTAYITRITFLNSSLRVLRKDNFINFPMLLRLVIRNSQLNEIEEGAFGGVAPNLTTIDFTGNKLNMINPKWFLDMTSLKELVLTNNQIEFIPPNSFAELTDLTQLHIDANLITRISIGNLNVLNSSNLTDVKLGSNPFVCDCYLLWLQQVIVDMSVRFLDSEQITCEYPSNVTGEQVSVVPLISTYCLNLCLAVICTENSSCTTHSNSFPICACNSGFDPIGNGTYECTPVDMPTSIIPVSSSLYPTDTTNIHLTSTSMQSLTNTSVPKISTTHVPTQSTISVHSTSATTKTPSPTGNTTNDIPIQSTISVYSTSTIRKTLSPTISVTTGIPSQSTASAHNPSLITVSSLSSHLITPSMIPNNTNNLQANVLILISVVVILILITVFIVCFIAFAVAFVVKKGREARINQSIEMTAIGPFNNPAIDASIDTNIIQNPLYQDSTLEAINPQIEDQISPT